MDLRDRPALRRQPQFPPEPAGARRRTSYARWSMKNALSINSSSCWPASTATFPASNSSSCLSRPPALPLAADELQDERRRATSSAGAYTTTLKVNLFLLVFCRPARFFLKYFLILFYIAQEFSARVLRPFDCCLLLFRKHLTAHWNAIWTSGESSQFLQIESLSDSRKASLKFGKLMKEIIINSRGLH